MTQKYEPELRTIPLTFLDCPDRTPRGMNFYCTDACSSFEVLIRGSPRDPNNDGWRKANCEFLIWSGSCPRGFR